MVINFQEFNSLKEEFHEKFYNEDNEFNGFNSNRVDVNPEEIQQLKVSVSLR